MRDDFLDFVLVAAPRSGTTWLATALAEHPRIWIPPHKEVNFFNEPFLSHWEFKYQRGIDYYKGIFELAPEDKVIGELTPTYYIDLQAAKRIHRHFPATKILILLRNPAEVVHSTYLKSSEHYPTADTLEEEIERRPELLKLGRYHRHLKPFFDIFPRDQIYVGTYEHFFANLEDSIATVYRFLGIDTDYRPSVLERKINPRRSVRWPILVKLRHGLRRLINTRPLLPLKRLLTKAIAVDMLDRKLTEMNLQQGKLPGLADDTRAWLMDTFEDDMRQFEELSGLDLSVWRK